MGEPGCCICGDPTFACWVRAEPLTHEGGHISMFNWKHPSTGQGAWLGLTGHPRFMTGNEGYIYKEEPHPR